MATLMTHLSGMWTKGYTRVAKDASEDVEMHELDSDDRTPLDRTIDRIGMGRYQWTLLALCGLGWLADTMWIQTVAIILPRVQQHYDVSDVYIGYLSSSMFAGMMFGSVGWGSLSDIVGRSTAFKLTLLLTSLCGLFAGFVASSFLLLCASLFLLGANVGGSMPTDGTLLVEHMPRGNRYLVTLTSIFFSFGSVISAIVGLILIPKHSCPPISLASSPCDIDAQNQGWRYFLRAMGFITLLFALARIAFFRLHESPRFLVQAGRVQDALFSLQAIARFNGAEIELGAHDIADRPRRGGAWRDHVASLFSPASRRTTTLVWAMWWSISLSYTMFNTFLPKILETHQNAPVAEKITTKSVEETMWDIVLFTVGGILGAPIGALLVKSRIGPRWTLAGSTFVAAAFTFIFVAAESTALTLPGISLSTSIMWCVLYGWTPEIFATAVRGTAYGAAGALSRIGGMIAPVLGGMLLVSSPSTLVLASAIILAFAGLCTVMVHSEGPTEDDPGVAH